MLNLSGVIEESIVDGVGIRYVIFTQGCPHHCEGCHNASTWDFIENKLYNEDDIIKAVESNFLVDGVTFSGGEPMMQAKPLIYIAQKVHDIGKTVWCYSGFTFEQIMSFDDERTELLKDVDVLVDGQFILAQRDISLQFRGSKNQRVIDVVETLKQGNIVLKYS
jgi:anaerobic ribonucleoside-triphosphate reductase activating protein